MTSSEHTKRNQASAKSGTTAEGSRPLRTDKLSFVVGPVAIISSMNRDGLSLHWRAKSRHSIGASMFLLSAPKLLLLLPQQAPFSPTRIAPKPC